MRKLLATSFLIALPAATHVVHAAQLEKPQPEKTIPVPANYREWIYMTSGIDMTYAATGTVGLTQEHKSIFDNVFVNPEAWAQYKQTGHWPDGTTFVLENRVAVGNVSINKGGHTQGADVNGLEVHQKHNGEWAFYVRSNDGAEHLLPRPASCYTCHESHGAVDTTFTQFYPTALPIAQQKSTLSDAYRKELSEPPAK